MRSSQFKACLLSALIFLFTLLIIASCDSSGGTSAADGDLEGDGTPLPDSCVSDFDCPDYMLCFESTCITMDENPCASEGACAVDNDCKASERCNDLCLCTSIVIPDGDWETEEDEEISDGDDPADPCNLGPQIDAEEELDFGYAQHDEDITLSAHIANLCDRPLTIHSVEIVSTSTEFSIFNPLTEAVILNKMGDSLEIKVIYHPADIGTDEGELLISSDDPDGALRIKLLSRYKGTVDIDVKPNPLDFHEVVVGTGPAERTLIVSNLRSGNEDNAVLRVNSVRLESASAAVFSIKNNPAPFYIAMGGEREVTLTCNPQDAGEFTDELIFESNDPDEESYSVAITCKGVRAELGVETLGEGNTLDFGAQRVDFPTSIVLTLSNAGGGTLNIDTPSLTDETAESFSLDVSEFGRGSVSLDAGQSVQLPVSFHSLSEGSFSGQILIPNDGFGTSEFRVNLAARALPGVITADPTPLDFGQIRVLQSNTLTLTLTNDGEVPLTLQSIGFSDPTEVLSFDAADLLADIELAPLQAHELHISFSPVARGNFNNMLHFTTDDAVNPEGDVPINAVGIGPVLVVGERDNPEFENILDFGEVGLGHQGERILDLSNEGDDPLNILGLGVSVNTPNGEFSFVDVGLVQIQAGNSVGITLHYDPTGLPGEDTGAFRISSDDQENDEVIIDLLGKATNQWPAISPTSPYQFNDVYFGASSSVSVQISNGGLVGDLLVYNIAVESGEEAFGIDTNGIEFPYTLRPNEGTGEVDKLVFDVLFHPPAGDSSGGVPLDYEGLLLIETNSYLESETAYELEGSGKPCEPGCWNLDEDPSDCEYCGCFISNEGVEICDGEDNDCNSFDDDGENVTNNCTPPNNSSPVCDNGSCDFNCDINFHRCVNPEYPDNSDHPQICLYDWDADHCGDSCDPCPDIPDNATALCEDVEGTPTCDFECNPSYILHNGICVMEDSAQCCGASCINCGENPDHGIWECEENACKVYCDPNYHPCGNECRDNNSVDSCGSNCQSCPEPELNGHATCDGANCAISCNPGFYQDGTNCPACDIPGHCGPNCINCGPLDNGDFHCDSGLCTAYCSNGYHACGNECVIDNSADHCGVYCVSCEGVYGTIGHGEYVCPSGSCEVDCDEDYHLCNNECVTDNDADHCGSDCASCTMMQGNLGPGHYTCPAGACVAVCDDGYQLENGVCVGGDTVDCCGDGCVECQPGTNSHPVCIEVSQDNWQCDTECNEDWWDLDEDGTNCEYNCVYDVPADDPDDLNTDSNCDGIDGVIVESIFVATNGLPSAAGTPDDPLDSIQAGVDAAFADPTRKKVLVSAGTYDGTVILKNGVGVFGGYNRSTGWTRASSNNVKIRINSSDPSSGRRVGILAHDLTSAAIFDQIEIEILNNTTASGSNYGFHFQNAAGLTVKRVTVTMGQGGDGDNGSVGYGATHLGAGGGTGGDGCGDGHTVLCENVLGFDCDRPTEGGGGAQNSCSYSQRPGDGGVGGIPGKDDNGTGELGLTGETGDKTVVNDHQGGTGGAGSTDDASPGGVGSAGSDGTNASAGGSFGTISGSGYYSPANGSANSTDGSGGRGGGGGGGGGGGIKSVGECETYGGAGGGGGSGGCGGQKGGSGDGGGGVFGMFFFNTQPTIQNVIIVSAQGGAGGSGGSGGSGSSGGTGGDGGDDIDADIGEDSGKGGKGGDGGDGGRGGHGGGGGGGPSYCFYSQGTPPSLSAQTYQCTEASGGGGGTSSGNGGTQGLSGVKNF